jgi:hypothetical protein
LYRLLMKTDKYCEAKESCQELLNLYNSEKRLDEKSFQVGRDLLMIKYNLSSAFLNFYGGISLKEIIKDARQNIITEQLVYQNIVDSFDSIDNLIMYLEKDGQYQKALDTSLQLLRATRSQYRHRNGLRPNIGHQYFKSTSTTIRLLDRAKEYSMVVSLLKKEIEYSDKHHPSTDATIQLKLDTIEYILNHGQDEPNYLDQCQEMLTKTTEYIRFVHTDAQKIKTQELSEAILLRRELVSIFYEEPFYTSGVSVICDDSHTPSGDVSVICNDSHTTSGVRANSLQTEINNPCIVCLSHARDQIFLPCAHVVCCLSCSIELDQCPYCRVNIEQNTRVFIP